MVYLAIGVVIIWLVILYLVIKSGRKPPTAGEGGAY